MRNLPRPPMPAGTILLASESVDYHSLSRAQALQLQSYQGRENEAEDFILACGLDITEAEAHEWRDAVTMDLAGELVDAILDISGLTRQGETDPKA